MKFMNMKRFGSVVMVGALALSLTAPAFAATNNTTTNIEGSYSEIPIAVVVPTTGTAQINPYGLPVDLTKSDTSTVTISNQQIVTQPLSLRNQGTVAMDVNAKLTVTPKGGVAIVASAPDASNKEAKVSLEVAEVDNDNLAQISSDPSIEDTIIDLFADTATWAGAKSLDANASTSTGGTVTPGAAVDSSATGGVGTLAVLGAASVDAGVVTYNSDSFALFRLTGEVTQEPTTAWAAADGFTANVVFKFTPAPPSPGDAAVTVAIAGTTAAATFRANTSGLTAVSYAWTSGTPATATIAGNGANATITNVSSNSGDTTVITVVVTLSNGSTITGTATHSIP